MFYTGPSPKLPHFEQRQRAQWDKKKQIAACAAELVEEGDTILLDGGSTTYEFAQHLVGRSLQVVTNSLAGRHLVDVGRQPRLGPDRRLRPSAHRRQPGALRQPDVAAN